MKYNPPAASRAYCGICGVPGAECTCLQFKERGADGTKAGSATADKGAPMKGAANGAANGGGEKKMFPGAAKPFGKKE